MKQLKRVTVFILAAAILFSLEGCNRLPSTQDEPSTEEDLSISQTAGDTETSVDYSKFSDLELLQEVIDGGYLSEWQFSSDITSYSIIGLVRRSESCPPLAELLSRRSAVESIRAYGPKLIENATGSTQFALFDIVYCILCPDMRRDAVDIDTP